MNLCCQYGYMCCVALFMIGLVSSDISYQCFNESERVTLSYMNNISKPLAGDLLPTIRLFQGVYGSQHAMQWTAYVYLTELMGVNVSWFPSDEPNVWYDSAYDDLVTNKTLGIAYPYYYFQTMAMDLYDLCLEIWPLQKLEGNADEFFDNGTIIDGGFSGVYAETGWFLPTYLADDLPMSIVPYYLRNDGSLRRPFIDSVVSGGSVNYIDYAGNVTGNHFPFDTPTNDRPIIFGSSHSYVMSEYSYNLTRNMFDYTGLNWSFVTLGGEGVLSEMMFDLYQNGQPFLANLYGPHIDFGTVINESTGEIMEFQRVALPRNPSNTVEEECYIEAQCAQPIDTLGKIGNAKLYDTFEEMVTFMKNFEMDATAVNTILLLHAELSAQDLTEYSDGDIWAMAACDWIKDNRDVVDQWFVSIERYDCSGGCGFTINGTDNIGGYCDEFSGDCICESSLLTQDCKTSCPGLIGPIWNIQNQNYSFQECSGHGTCDMTTLTCEADLGWGKIDASYEYPMYDYDDVLFAVFTTLYTILAIILLASVIWLRLHSDYKMVRALAPNMSTAFTVGLILLCCGCVVYMINPVNDATCILKVFLYGIGANLAIAAPLLKAYRVALLFDRAKKLKEVVVRDRDLLIYFVPLLAIELLICVAYTIAHQIGGGVEMQYNDDYLRIEKVCNTTDTTAAINQANYIYGFALLLVFTVVAFKTRVAAKVFKEHQCAFFGSFFSLFAFATVFAFHATVDDLDVLISVQVTCTWIVLVVVWVLFYGKLLYKFYSREDSRAKVGSMRRTRDANSRTGNYTGSGDHSGDHSGGGGSGNRRSQQQSNQPPTTPDFTANTTTVSPDKRMSHSGGDTTIQLPDIREADKSTTL